MLRELFFIMIAPLTKKMIIIQFGIY